MKKPELDICPNCLEKSLWWNVFINRYECLNKKCRRKFSSESIFKYKESAFEDRLGSGTQYWDAKRKEWRDGKKPTVHWTHKYWTWVFIIIGLIIVGVVIALIRKHL